MTDGPDQTPVSPAAVPTDSSGNNSEGPPAPIASAKRTAKDNLTPWKKGQSGNKKGRPKGMVLSQPAMELMQETAPAELLEKLPPYVKAKLGKRPTMAKMLMWRVAINALGGDMTAVKLLFDRLEGKAPQQVHEEQGDQLDELMKVLMQGGKPVGEVND